jgi:outer membrane protein W
LSSGTLTYSFSINQVVNAGSYYYLEITHNLGYNPNVTVKNSAGDVLETGIDYNSINKITLTMAQPFGGTAYLS